ncbi:hypothetical protein LSAT2_019053 [Lamellibrachia satsuma]|nr:hypothetical protein LSAT2_019053 [Lamellibrachia satsuma]
MEAGDSRCRVCADKKRRWRNPGRLLGCLNFCLVVAGIVYLGVLHREVSILRTELGRCSGAVVTPASKTGNGQVDGRVGETDEMIYTNGQQSPQKMAPREQVPGRQARGKSPRKGKARKNKRRHRSRRRDIKAVHMEGRLPSAVSHTYPDLTFRHWHPTEWTEKYFASMYEYNENTGRTTVNEDGLYFLYSQVTTEKTIFISSHSVIVDGEARFTCQHEVPSVNSKQSLSDTCSTSGVVLLRQGQTISIRKEYSDAREIMQPNLTYWGMIKLANVPKLRV